MRNYILLFVLIGLIKSTIGYSQVLNFEIGVKDSVQSKILNENRQLIIHLPKDYETSNSTYPILYVLDGNETSLLEAITITRKLRVETIIVAIPNTDRDRDMMPLSTPTYEVKNPGAENFLSFLEKELVPHIEKNYRSNGQRTISGKSLSGLFVMYAFLENPELFDHYIGNSAGWYADMNPFFSDLVEKAFKNKEQFHGKKLFVANSLADRFDPNKEVHNAVLEFSERLNSEFGEKVFFTYKTYEDYGHVPFPSLYDGLRYVLELE